MFVSRNHLSSSFNFRPPYFRPQTLLSLLNLTNEKTSQLKNKLHIQLTHVTVDPICVYTNYTLYFSLTLLKGKCLSKFSLPLNVKRVLFYERRN